MWMAWLTAARRRIAAGPRSWHSPGAGWNYSPTAARCRRSDGDVWRIDCSRFEKIGRNGETLDPCAGWTWNRHGHYDSHIPEVFPYVTFSEIQVGQARGLQGVHGAKSEAML